MGEAYISEIRTFSATFCPAGWLETNGQEVSIWDYETLFVLSPFDYDYDAGVFTLPKITVDNGDLLKPCIDALLYRELVDNDADLLACMQYTAYNWEQLTTCVAYDGYFPPRSVADNIDEHLQDILKQNGMTQSDLKHLKAEVEAADERPRPDAADAKSWEPKSLVKQTSFAYSQSQDTVAVAAIFLLLVLAFVFVARKVWLCVVGKTPKTTGEDSESQPLLCIRV